MAELQGRALDAAVAERVMGWTLDENYWQQPDECQLYVDDWSPCYDYGDVKQVRAEIERRGLVREFVLCLSQQVDSIEFGCNCWDCLWRILNATPEQQCRAALKAVEGANA